jgi:Immunity protein 35
MDKQAARRIAERLLDIEVRPHLDGEIVIVDQSTMQNSEYWAFCYDSKEYLETGNISHALAGNSPIFVRKSDGDAFFGRTDIPLEDQLEAPGRGLDR